MNMFLLGKDCATSMTKRSVPVLMPTTGIGLRPAISIAVEIIRWSASDSCCLQFIPTCCNSSISLSINLALLLLLVRNGFFGVLVVISSSNRISSDDVKAARLLYSAIFVEFMLL